MLWISMVKILTSASRGYFWTLTLRCSKHCKTKSPLTSRPRGHCVSNRPTTTTMILVHNCLNNRPTTTTTMILVHNCLNNRPTTTTTTMILVHNCLTNRPTPNPWPRPISGPRHTCRVSWLRPRRIACRERWRQLLLLTSLNTMVIPLLRRRHQWKLCRWLESRYFFTTSPT